MSKSSKSDFRDIKRQNTVPERYTDEPVGSSSSAIPLLNNYDEDTHGPDEVLPGYNDQDNDGDFPPPFTTYIPVVKKIRTGFGMCDTLTVSHDPHLNNDGEALYRWLKEESLTPPNPQVHIRGTHQTRRRKGDKTETSTTTDFDLRLSLKEYFVEGIFGNSPHLETVDQDKKTNRGGRWKTVATDLEATKLSVRSWADQYCEDKSTLKEFIMKKSCEGWDLTLLKNKLEGMIRSTNYLGSIDISFPVFETRVEVFPSNRISRMRKNVYWRWFFYLTFLWIFTWPFLWFFTKRYHVAETVWHYSTWEESPGGTQGRTHKVFVQEEEDWLMFWGSAIKRAAKAHRQGFVTIHDIDEMRQARSEGRTGTVIPLSRTIIDNPLRFMAGVGSIANDMILSRSDIIGWGGSESF